MGAQIFPLCTSFQTAMRLPALLQGFIPSLPWSAILETSKCKINNKCLSLSFPNLVCSDTSLSNDAIRRSQNMLHMTSFIQMMQCQELWCPCYCSIFRTRHYTTSSIYFSYILQQLRQEFQKTLGEQLCLLLNLKRWVSLQMARIWRGGAVSLLGSLIPTTNT